VPLIAIDNKEYDTDTLSDEVKANLASLQFTDAEIERLQAKLAVLQTARMAYARAVNEGLNGGSSETVKADPPKKK